jgi:hypothetical protein
MAGGDPATAVDTRRHGVRELADLIASAAVVDVSKEIEVLVDEAVAIVVDAVTHLLLWLAWYRVAFIRAAVGGAQ